MLETLIQQKINELPENIKNAIEEFDWATEVSNIAQNYHLQINTMEIFRREILLVIVGATDATDFEKNLVSHMGITHNLAEELVADANKYIFRPLQKKAFSHNEEEFIQHNEISNIMNEHGITLVDEFEPEPKPQNELQNLADSLFKNTEPTISESQTLISNSTENNIEEFSHKKPIEYNEPIEESDLLGIHEHRINTDIINQTRPEEILENNTEVNYIQSFDTPKKNNMEYRALNKTHISKTALLDTSPTKADLVKENKEFLKHIGAS